MASGYALPLSGGHAQYGHPRGHSFSDANLSPFAAEQGNFPASDGGFMRKAVSHSALYTHAETSRENSPYITPSRDNERSHYFDRDHSREQAEDVVNSAPRPSLKMKGRARGESDLGRPANPNSSAYRRPSYGPPTASTPWDLVKQVSASMLIPLPYLFACAASNSATARAAEAGVGDQSEHAKLRSSVLGASSHPPAHLSMTPRGMLEACALTSGTLLVIGLVAKMTASERTLDRRKGSSHSQVKIAYDMRTLRAVATRSLSIALPFFASLNLGGVRTGLVLLASIATSISCGPSRQPLDTLLHAVSTSKATITTLGICFLADLAGVTLRTSMSSFLLGYLALIGSVFVFPLPLPSLGSSSVTRSASKVGTPVSPAGAPWRRPSSVKRPGAVSSLVCSAADIDLTLLAGGLLSILTGLATIFFSASPLPAVSSFLFGVLSVASTVLALHVSQPSALRRQLKSNLGVSCLFNAGSGFFLSSSIWPGAICDLALSALVVTGALLDTSSSARTTNGAAHEQIGNAKKRHQRSARDHSAFTDFILQRCEAGSLVHSILLEKDSRRIAYFTW